MNLRFLAYLACCWVAALSSIGIARPAQAHQTAMSNLTAEIRPEKREIDLLLAVSAEDLGSFLKLDTDGQGFVDDAARKKAEPPMAAYLSARLKVLNNGAICPAKSAGFVTPEKRMMALFYRKTVVCDAALAEVQLVNRVLLEDVGGYTHYGRIQLGEDIHTTVFNPSAPSYTVEVLADQQAMAEQNLGEVFADFVWQGALHIWLGLDHVLFVLCLLLAAGNFRRLLAVVTSFTVAHSITLALSALDIMTISPQVVEPLIALSIAWVAVEIIVAQQRSIAAQNTATGSQNSEQSPRFSLPQAAGKHLFAVTFLFGLLHGFGFSYVLRDEIGLPTDALMPALFSFNVGVELGQIAVVCVAFPLVVWMRQKRWGSRGIQLLSAAVLLVSLYWLVTRIFFG